MISYKISKRTHDIQKKNYGFKNMRFKKIYFSKTSL